MRVPKTLKLPTPRKFFYQQYQISVHFSEKTVRNGVYPATLFYGFRRTLYLTVLASLNKFIRQICEKHTLLYLYMYVNFAHFNSKFFFGSSFLNNLQCEIFENYMTYTQFLVTIIRNMQKISALLLHSFMIEIQCPRLYV